MNPNCWGAILVAGIVASPFIAYAVVKSERRRWRRASKEDDEGTVANEQK